MPTSHARSSPRRGTVVGQCGPASCGLERSQAVLRERRTHDRDTPQTRYRCGFTACSAEREGFEPSTSLTTRNGFRDRRIRPLCHLSERANSTGAHATEVLSSARSLAEGYSGEGGIRTLDAGLYPRNALAGRRLQPLGHFSGLGMVSHVLRRKSPFGVMTAGVTSVTMWLPVLPFNPGICGARHLR